MRGGTIAERLTLDHADWTGKPAYPWLVETAAATFGIELDGNSVEGHQFATNRMLFVEFCPYASSPNGRPSIGSAT